MLHTLLHLLFIRLGAFDAAGTTSYDGFLLLDEGFAPDIFIKLNRMLQGDAYHRIHCVYDLQLLLFLQA